GGVIWSGKTPSLRGNLYEKNSAAKYGGVLFSKQDKPSENSCSFGVNGAGYGGDNYYTQSQKNNAPAATYGTLAAMIVVLIVTIILSIVSAGALAGTFTGTIAAVASAGGVAVSAADLGTMTTVVCSVVAGLIVGGITIGVVFLSEYLFELVPEFKKFNERNPLLLPLISLALVICGAIFVIGEAVHAVGGIIAALGKGLIVLVQHIDDLVTVIIFGVKAGASAGSGNDSIKPPDLPEYQNNLPPNDSNSLFKGISFKYNGIDINLADYNLSDLNMTSYNNESGLCDFNFQANPNIGGYPIFYCKGSCNTMNYYMTIDFFTSVGCDSSSVYTWKGYWSDLFNT
ncbi:MAG: hypothetical protein LBT10_00405, partial [Methanobrevibacter sp.]|nr:hypothetical protein [Methanobrevibacter sp.]